MSKIKIWSNGLSKDTRIGVVDNGGYETPLTMVESIDFTMPKNDKVGRLQMSFIIGNQVEIEIPVDDHAAARLQEIGPSWQELRSALIGVPVLALEDAPPWLARLHQAALAMSGLDIAKARALREQRTGPEE